MVERRDRFRQRAVGNRERGLRRRPGRRLRRRELSAGEPPPRRTRAARRARSSSRSSPRRGCPRCSCSRRRRRRASSPETSCRCCRRSPPRPRSHSIGPARPTRWPTRSSANASSRRSGGRCAPSSTSTTCSESPSRRPASATGVSRCFLRLGEPSKPMPIAAEWTAPGFAPIGAVADHLAVSNLAARDRRTVAVGDIREESALADPALGGIESAARARQPRRARDAGPRVRPHDRDLRAPPRRAGRVVGRRDRARRGRRARAGHRDPRGAAAPRERAAPRTADGAPQGGPGRDERAPARDRPPAARRRGDEAARCGRGRLLPLRLGQFAPPLRGRPRARPGPRRLRVPGRALGRRAIHGARAAPRLPGVRERDLGADDLVGRAARRPRRRDARPGATLRRARAEPARDLRRPRVARGPQRGELRAERPPGAGAARLLRDRLRAVRAPLAVGDPRRGRPRRERGARWIVHRGADARRARARARRLVPRSRRARGHAPRRDSRPRPRSS